MLIGFYSFKKSSILKMFNDFLICILDKLSLPSSHLILEGSIKIHQLNNRQVIFFTNIIVILTKCRSYMDDSSPIFHGNKISGDDIPCFLIWMRI